MAKTVRRILLGALLAAGLLVAGTAARTALRASYLDRRLAEFDLTTLPEHGRRAYERLVGIDIVEGTWRSLEIAPVDAGYRLFDLWDLPAETSTAVFLALCEHGTPAARFYGLAGLAGSDPWTFERAVERYGHGQRDLHLQFGCWAYSGDEERHVRDHLLDDSVALHWRTQWYRTERSGDGPEPWRDLRAEFRQ